MRQKTLFDDDLTFEEAQELIKNGADVNGKDDHGLTPLFFVLDTDICQLLIDHGADVNFQNHHGMTAPHLSVQFHVEITKLLISYGADVNAKTTHGWTPLFYTEDPKTAELLFNAGVNINERSLSLITCLSTISDSETLEFLIKNGAVASIISHYHVLRMRFSKTQQEAFDMFLSLTNNDEDFFKMCLAYQEGIKNHVNIEIKDMDIV